MRQVWVIYRRHLLRVHERELARLGLHEDAAEPAPKGPSKVEARRLERIARSIREGVDENLKTIPGLRTAELLGKGSEGLIRDWRKTNVGLIKKVETEHLERIEKTIKENANLHVAGLRDKLQEEFGISESKARFWARDQTLKLNADLQQERQTRLGIVEYVWHATPDARTRPRHKELDGTRHRWDTPPEVAPGRHEHPGKDYQCRCYSEPILPGEERLAPEPSPEAPRRPRAEPAAPARPEPAPLPEGFVRGPAPRPRRPPSAPFLFERPAGTPVPIVRTGQGFAVATRSTRRAPYNPALYARKAAERRAAQLGEDWHAEPSGYLHPARTHIVEHRPKPAFVREVRALSEASYAREGMRATSLESLQRAFAGLTAVEAEFVATHDLPAVIVHVWREKGKTRVVLVDGRHRMRAAAEAGAQHIRAQVIERGPLGGILNEWHGIVPIGNLDPGQWVDPLPLTR